MKKFLVLLSLWIFAGCAAQQHQSFWRARTWRFNAVRWSISMAKRANPSDDTDQNDSRADACPYADQTFGQRVNRALHCRWRRTNAFAGMVNTRRVIGISVAMIKLIGGEANEYAALISNEAACWAECLRRSCGRFCFPSVCGYACTGTACRAPTSEEQQVFEIAGTGEFLLNPECGNRRTSHPSN